MSDFDLSIEDEEFLKDIKDLSEDKKNCVLAYLKNKLEANTPRGGAIGMTFFKWIDKHERKLILILILILAFLFFLKLFIFFPGER